MFLDTEFCSVLPPFCHNFKDELCSEFIPLFGGLLRPTTGKNGTKRNLTPCCRNAHLIQMNTLLVPNSIRLSKSVWSVAKDMPTLVLGLDFRHTSMSIESACHYWLMQKSLNESISPIAASTVSVGFKSYMPVDAWAHTNVFETTVITAEASVGIPKRRLGAMGIS